MADFAFPSAQANNCCEGQTLKAWVLPNKKPEQLETWIDGAGWLLAIKKCQGLQMTEKMR
jgi:hypothetical protein